MRKKETSNSLLEKITEAISSLDGLPKPSLKEFKQNLINLFGEDEINNFEKNNGEIRQIIIWGQVYLARSIDFDVYSIEVIESPIIDKNRFIMIGANSPIFNDTILEPWINTDFNTDNKANYSNFIPIMYK